MQLRIDLGDRTVVIEAEAGIRLSQAVWLSGVVPPAQLCGGLGLCGRCRLQFVSQPPLPTPDELAFFSQAELAAGWRLACRHTTDSSGSAATLRIPVQTHGILNQPNEFPAAQDEVALGVDLGTTSIEWQGVSTAFPGEPAAHGSLLNPQAGAGADVISRLEYCAREGHTHTLSGLAWDALNGIRLNLEARGLRVVRAALAANTAMLEILLESPTEGLRCAPYSVAYAGGEVIAWPGTELPLVIPPVIAPFIGADISSGLLTLLDMPKPLVLADLGTNAELALLTADGGLFMASVPLGPAMEGVGPRHGALAGSGVATSFQLGPGGLEPRFPAGDSASSDMAKGISATGYLSLLGILRTNGVIDPEGHFRSPANLDTPLARKLASNITELAGEGVFRLGNSLALHAGDIEMLLKVKAAFSVALARLCKAAGVDVCALQSLALAGSISSHANIGDLVDLGFLPRCLARRATACGNSALQGACRLALKPDLLETLRAMCGHAVVVNLAGDTDFFNDYLASMRW